MAESSINWSHWIYESNDFYWAFYSRESCHLSKHTLKLFNLAGSLAHVQQFSRLLDKFEVWVKQFVTFLISFSVWFFKMEFSPLPDLLHTKSVIEIGFFYDGEHIRAKICRLLTFFSKITSRWRFLVDTKSGITTCENTLNTGWILWTLRYLLLKIIFFTLIFKSSIF